MLDKIKKQINQIKESKDGRTLVANFSYLTLLQVAGYIFPLITMPYLARVIGVDGFGKIAFAAAIIVWFQTISDWGFNFTATRDVAQNRDNKDKLSEIFSRVLWSRCILMFISLIILIICINIIPIIKENSAIILVTFLIVPGHIMFPDWFFQAMERMKYTTILNLVSKLLFTIAVFVFIKDSSDYILQPLFISLGFLFSGIFSMWIIIHRWGYKLIRPSFSEISFTIKNSTNVFINNITPTLYNSFSILLLGYYGGPVSNGIFNAGEKFVTITQQFMNVVTRTFFPFLSRRIDKHYLYEKINILLSIIATIILFIFSPYLIKLFFTPDFYQAITVLKILTISIVFMSLTNVYGTNYLIIRGYEVQLRNITVISSILGFVISFPLILFFDYIGAAITITFTRAYLGVSIMSYAYKIKNHEANKENNKID